METVPSLAETIFDNGIIIVLAAAFLVVMGWAIKWLFSIFKDMWHDRKKDKDQSEKKDELSEMKSNAVAHVSKEITDVIALAVSQALRLQQEDHHRDMIDSSILSKKVNNILMTLREQTGADRVSLFSYHNGGQDMLGRPFPKMSCTDQITRIGVRPTQSNYQSIFKTFLNAIVDDIQTLGHFYATSVDYLKETDYASYCALIHDETKQFYAKGLKNSIGITIGFISLEYITNEKHTTSKIQHELGRYTHIIEGILMAKREVEREQ